MIGGAISLSEPFTPFTALSNNENPAFGPFTRVKGCDPEIVNDFSEVNGVKGKSHLERRQLEASGESPGLKPRSMCSAIGVAPAQIPADYWAAATSTA